MKGLIEGRSVSLRGPAELDVQVTMIRRLATERAAARNLRTGLCRPAVRWADPEDGLLPVRRRRIRPRGKRDRRHGLSHATGSDTASEVDVERYHKRRDLTLRNQTPLARRLRRIDRQRKGSIKIELRVGNLPRTRSFSWRTEQGWGEQRAQNFA